MEMNTNICGNEFLVVSEDLTIPPLWQLNDQQRHLPLISIFRGFSQARTLELESPEVTTLSESYSFNVASSMFETMKHHIVAYFFIY